MDPFERAQRWHLQAVVGRLVGYQRLEAPALAALEHVHELAREYVNFLYPVSWRWRGSRSGRSARSDCDACLERTSARVRRQLLPPQGAVLDVAEQLLREALRVSERADDLQGLRNGSSFLGTLVTVRGELDEADPLYGRALAIGRRIGEWAWEAAVVTLLAHIRYERGDITGAGELVAEALGICKLRKAPTSLGRALVLSGRLALDGRDETAAIQQIRDGLAVLRSLRDHTGLTFAYTIAAHRCRSR